MLGLQICAFVSEPDGNDDNYNGNDDNDNDDDDNDKDDDDDKGKKEECL